MFFNNNFIKYLSLYVLSIDLHDKKNFKRYKLTKEIPFHSRICIYGFGPYGRSVLRNYFFHTKIVGIFDVSLSKIYKNVLSPYMIKDYSFDYILITVMNEVGKKEVLKFLMDNNVTKEQIVLLEYE